MEKETEEPVKLTIAQRNRMKGWINDLESGKFKQTAGRLKDSTGHCCLGVACERLARAGLGTWTETVFIIEETPRSQAIPRAGERFYGFNKLSSDPRRWQSHYAAMNDMGSSFMEIAAEMRKNFGIPKKEKK